MFIHPVPTPSPVVPSMGVKPSTVLVLIGVNVAVFALLASGFFVYKRLCSSSTKAAESQEAQVLEANTGSDVTMDLGTVAEAKNALTDRDELDNAEKGLCSVLVSCEDSPPLSPVNESSTVDRGVDPKILEKQVEEHKLTVVQFQQLCIQALEVRKSRMALKKERLKALARRQAACRRHGHGVALHGAGYSIPPPGIGDEEATVEQLVPRGEGLLDKLLASLGMPIVYDDDEDRLSLSASSVSEQSSIDTGAETPSSSFETSIEEQSCSIGQAEAGLTNEIPEVSEDTQASMGDVDEDGAKVNDDHVEEPLLSFLDAVPEEENQVKEEKEEVQVVTAEGVVEKEGTQAEVKAENAKEEAQEEVKAQKCVQEEATVQESAEEEAPKRASVEVTSDRKNQTANSQKSSPATKRASLTRSVLAKTPLAKKTEVPRTLRATPTKEVQGTSKLATPVKARNLNAPPVLRNTTNVSRITRAVAAPKAPRPIASTSTKRTQVPSASTRNPEARTPSVVKTAATKMTLAGPSKGPISSRKSNLRGTHTAATLVITSKPSTIPGLRAPKPQATTTAARLTPNKPAATNKASTPAPTAKTSAPARVLAAAKGLKTAVSRNSIKTRLSTAVKPPANAVGKVSVKNIPA